MSISREDARTAFVRSAERTYEAKVYDSFVLPSSVVTVYEVKVVRSSGEEVVVHEDQEEAVAYLLKRRILAFAWGRAGDNATPPEP